MAIRMKIPKIAFVIPYQILNNGVMKPVTTVRVCRGEDVSLTLSVFLLDTSRGETYELATTISALNSEDDIHKYIAKIKSLARIDNPEVELTNGQVMELPLTFPTQHNNEAFYHIEVSIIGRDNPFIQRWNSARLILKVIVED